MNEEWIEEWDENFLNQVIQAEELASSSTQKPNPNPNPLISTSTATYPHPHQQNRNDPISYSPPRELSQRPTDFDANGFAQCGGPPSVSLCKDNAKDQEIDRLKRELGCYSKQLNDLERECSELRKERTRKEEHIKSVYSHSIETDVDARCLKNKKFECGIRSVDTHGASSKSVNTKCLEDNNVVVKSSKAIGVQTDYAGDCENDLPSDFALSNKLLGIWGYTTTEQNLGRNLISKLFMACPEDFQLLFGCMSMNMSTKVPANSVACGSAYGVSLQGSEAEKVSHLYSVFTKISNGILPLDSLFEPLLDLCNLKNVSILQSSLSILHVFLRHLLSLGRKLEERDNVKFEGLCSGNNTEGVGLFNVSWDEASYTGCKLSGFKSSGPPSFCKKGYQNIHIALSRVNWVSLFDLMREIAKSNKEECVRVEAISIMNLILMRSNAYTERERFGETMVFDSIANFLKNEAGLHVQKESLYLLYLLLNCPKLLSIFCSYCVEETGDVVKKNASAIKTFTAILEGLADCISCSGNGVKDTELRKQAVVMLAFLASSGKMGYEILVGHKLPGERNFLMLILQVLASEVDTEVSVSVEPVESVKARTLFIREALILLNRLVSNPGYSPSVLRALTANRDMATLTIDIASRLSRKDHGLRIPDSALHKTRDSEIVDLARVFRRRVFTYVGDKIS